MILWHISRNRFTIVPTLVLPIVLGFIASIVLGRISLIEILAIAWILVKVILNPAIFLDAFSSKSARVGLSLVTAFMLFISDLINNSSLDVLIKGVGAYLLFPITVLFLIKTLNFHKLTIVFFSFSLFSFFLAERDADISFTSDEFKFGYASVTITLVLMFFSYLPRLCKLSAKTIANLELLAVVILVILSAWGNLRLLSLLAIIAFILSSLNFNKLPLYLQILNLNSLKVSLLLPSGLLVLSIALSFAATLVLNIVSIMPQGLISDVAISKTQYQMTGQLGLLFGGRFDIFAAFIAWNQKPWLGWGSWALDPNDYFEIAGYKLMNELGYQFDLVNLINLIDAGITYPFIPTHSALLNLLVWGGLLSLIPFYIFFATYISNFLRTISRRVSSTPLFLSLTFMNSVWSILFSPFGYTQRLEAAIWVALVMSYSGSNSSSTANVNYMDPIL